jgi:hypothetical protein
MASLGESQNFGQTHMEKLCGKTWCVGVPKFETCNMMLPDIEQQTNNHKLVPGWIFFPTHWLPVTT